MADHLDELTSIVRKKLKRLGFAYPNKSILRVVLETAYLATLKTEEGRFVKGSITFADPTRPEIDPPLTRRADYPSFSTFGHALPLTVETLAKLSRAIDKWSGSIAIYGTETTNLIAWGVIDQLVHQNIRLNRESRAGAASPGIITVVMDGVGELSVYHHGDLFLGSLRQNRIVEHENDALRTSGVYERIGPRLLPIAAQIVNAVDSQINSDQVLNRLFDVWANTIARLCIGLRRVGVGGAFVITDAECSELIEICYPLNYSRLGEAAFLSVLDDVYETHIGRTVRTQQNKDAVDADLVIEQSFAETDASDRKDELTGAVKLVTSFATIDGAVLLNKMLRVVGFGAKLKSAASIGNVYNGADFVKKGASAELVDPSRFGTRHGSMLRHCRSDPDSIGVVVSQDGQVRVILTVGRQLVLWDDVRLLDYYYDIKSYAKYSKHSQRHRSQRRHETRLGYTDMPKTLKELLG